MKKQLTIKDIKDKKLIKLIKNLRDIIININNTQWLLDERYSKENNKLTKEIKKEAKTIHNLVKHLNKDYNKKTITIEELIKHLIKNYDNKDKILYS